jgi:glucose-6-phosphate isomerase
MTRLTSSPAWKALMLHAQTESDMRIQNLVEHEAGRVDAMTLRIDDMAFDFTKNLASAQTLKLLLDLAQQQDVKGWFARMFEGAPINTTENRAVLHTDLRKSQPSVEVQACMVQMKAVSDAVRADQSITDIVHIGIGGSDFGPRMVCQAVADLYQGPRIHFVANVDPDDLDVTLARLDPSRTFVTVASKTFTTDETMTNLTAVRAWLGGSADRVVAMTANTKAAADAGISESRVLPMWDWVGGRYSVWSSIGLPIAIACGFEGFKDFLKGAHAVDTHVARTPYAQNAPVMMALLGVWYRNFMKYPAVVIAPYSQRLERFSDYMQQVGMESNGKRIDRDGAVCDYETSPIIFGQAGTNAQHAFFQMVHQGTTPMPVDFIGFKTPHSPRTQAHDKLLQNMYAQGDALMLGCDDANPHKVCPGNRPSTSIVLPKFDLYHLGALMAIYEHKTAAEGFLLNINSFDQFGVELGKKMAKQRLAS